MNREFVIDGITVGVTSLDSSLQHLLAPEEEQIAQSYRSLDAQLRFRCARSLAHHLILKTGGSADGPILRAESGAPLFPAGIVGSISHTISHVTAAVGLRSECISVGIDIERLDRSIAPAIASRILTEPERSRLSDKNGAETEQLLRTFSLKESVYKAYAPLGAPALGFQDIELCTTSTSHEVSIINFNSAIRNLNLKLGGTLKLFSFTQIEPGLVLSLALVK